jgi:Tfp pilus assembly protein PilX
MTQPVPQPTRRAILRGQEGITLIVVLGITLVTAMLLVAAFTSARGEIHLTSTDAAEKKAYYAAEAGIEDYEYHLTQDGNYLSYCTEPPSANSALNQYYKEGTKTPLSTSELKTAEVPAHEVSGVSEKTEETYAIQLLPAESDTEATPHCNTSNLVGSMLEEQGAATGTFRIESTGFYQGHQRSLVATFRNANFVSYVWYTKYETFDPSKYGTPIRTQCENFYGKRPGESQCQNNYFISGESVNGPMHTEDHVGICGKPVFGRTPTDRIEFGQLKTETLGYSVEEDGGCSGGAHPEFKGTHIPPTEVKPLEPPPGDEELLHIVEEKYHYTNKTEIVLTGTTMTVTQNKGSASETTESNVPFPPNGVIYVSGSCGTLYSPFGPKPGYTEDSGCGNVYVHGEYAASLTIAAQNDIIINGNLLTPRSGETPTTNALLGLIANNFVRIYHPVAKTYAASGTSCNNGDKYNSTLQVCEYTNTASSCDAPNMSSAEAQKAGVIEDLKNPEIYAAILALKHAVVVDNYDCGAASLEHLNIYGAVAGLFSNGLTGEFNGSTGVIEHGYPYNANYDNRLQIEEPPHFLNPIQAAWYIQRQTLATNP